MQKMPKQMRDAFANAADDASVNSLNIWLTGRQDPANSVHTLLILSGNRIELHVNDDPSKPELNGVWWKVVELPNAAGEDDPMNACAARKLAIAIERLGFQHRQEGLDEDALEAMGFTWNEM